MKINKFALLRRIISFSALIFISLGLFGICNSVFLFLSKLQFGRFFLDMSAASAVLCLFILLISAVFGRIYCSLLCPLGVFQDLAGALGTSLTRKKYFFHGNLYFKLFRYLIFALAAMLFILGAPSLIGILDPYSIYIRGASRMLDHTAGAVMNTIAPVLRNYNIYSAYLPGSFHFMPVAVLILIFFAAFFRGRLFCNTLCPVGLILGCASRASVVRPAFKDNCVSCGKCEAVCKSECISVPDKLIDLSRCVMCGNCVSACPVAAMDFSKKSLKHNHEKRETIKSIASIAVFAALPLSGRLSAHIPALSALSEKIKKSNLYPQIPAGAMSWARLRDKCVACHACIKRCPSRVLEPVGVKFGINGILKPALSFNKGFCQYDCVECGQACPFGAIMPLSVNEKHKTQTGIVSYVRELCVIIAKGEHCGACAEHCPTGALEMALDGESHEIIPTIIPKLCVGCGACEYICPVIPQKAVFIRPLAVHQAAEILERRENIIMEKSDGFMF